MEIVKLAIDIIAIVLSVYAIYTAKATEVKQEQFEAIQNKPDCRIKAASIGEKLIIRVENVGAGIMQVHNIQYKLDGGCSDNKHLSAFFDGIQYLTRTEASLTGDHLFPCSVHKLITMTFSSQQDLLDAWDIVKRITVVVNYSDVHGNNFPPAEKSLLSEYETFKAALGDRQLNAFSREEKIDQSGEYLIRIIERRA